jgi:hypothetical protein
VQSMQNIEILSRLATDRAAQLRSARSVRGANRSRHHVRRWFGFQLVRLGAWVAAEPAMRPLTAR